MTSLAEDIERVSEEEASSSDQQGNPADQDESQQVPNVIMVQLESFIDPNRLEGFTYSENPVPVLLN